MPCSSLVLILFSNLGSLGVPLEVICITSFSIVIIIVQSLSCVRLFVTPWTAAHQASLSFVISRSLLKLMSIESVMPSNHLILCHPLLFLPSGRDPASGSFPLSWPFVSCGQSIGASASSSVLPIDIAWATYIY